MMQQRRQLQRSAQQGNSQQIFTASELAEFEYCPLAWWYEQYEPTSKEDTEELFARMVELEAQHDAAAPALPEYQLLEQLLLRRGAFDEGRQQHLAHAEQVAGSDEVEDERTAPPVPGGMSRRLIAIAIVLLVVALALIALSLLLRR